jgi:cytochrome c oxidase cbb3-type subunit 1
MAQDENRAISAPSTTAFIDAPAKVMLYPAIFFMLVGMMAGVFIAFNGFLFPDYYSGEYLHFGKVRPVHVGHVTLLWLLSANVGLFYFFVPRLCGVPLWSPKMAYVAAALWWFSLVIGNYSYPWGTNFGWEYAELPVWVSWVPIKVLFALAWILVVYNLFATIATRRYEKMYVSLWYTMGTMIWTTFTVIVGFFVINLVHMGMSRVNVSFFYVHNLVGLIYTPMGLAQAYYFLPKLAGAPIYSHWLSMVGFWSIAFVYAWIGAHHIIHGPVSQWLQTTAIVFSIWLFIPVWTVVMNLLYTLKGHWEKYSQSAPIRFIIMGVVFYLITCIQGPLMALRNINEITSKTDWVIGHSHISLYATFTFFAAAGIYYAVPVMEKKPLWSDKLADLHFSLSLFGSVFFILSLWIGGFWQGMLWSTWANGNNYLQYHENFTMLSFLDTVADMRIWWTFRAIGGIIILFANILFVVNIFNTILLSPRKRYVSQTPSPSAAS